MEQQLIIIKTTNPKSQSKRFRNILYLLWAQNTGGFVTFEEYYEKIMDKLIEEFKAKISG